MRARLLAALAALAVLGAGCTAVPGDSTPQVVQSMGADQAGPQQTIKPQPGAQPRSIVEAFIAANDLSDPNHNSAQSFLTGNAKNTWLGTTITVVDDLRVANPDGNRVVLSGQKVGEVDATGVYTTVNNGNGAGVGGVPFDATFGMTSVDGQWRIGSVDKTGLIISSDDFQLLEQRYLYFFDAAQQHLVPDPRYTQLVDPKDLVAWLVARLVDGPRNGLVTALPSKSDSRRVLPTFPTDANPNAPLTIDIPGASQLNASGLNRLAAQIAGTLSQIGQVTEIEITDDGTPVRIPQVRSTTFTAEQLSSLYTVTAPTVALFYVRNGAVYNSAGQRMPGKVGAGSYGLTSVALTPRGSSDDLLVAGTRGKAGAQMLDIGTADKLVATDVHGTLSRPAWAPDLNEVWIGEGDTLYRVSPTGAASVVPVDAAGGPATGRVTAVRLSPEGSRVALVLSLPGGSSQAWIGDIVRSAGTVRVTGLTAITPTDIKVTDIAWNDQLKLFAIGTDETSRNYGVFEVQCDGSLWTPRGTSGLPGAPDSVTVVPGAVVAVSTGNTVERQNGGAWEGLNGRDTTGRNPVYVE